MAAEGLDIDRDIFCCPICRDLLKDPVTIPCGHSYCMSCVSTHWDGEEGKSYSCSQCEQNFRRRPVLVKNTMLAALVEGFNRSDMSAAAAGDGGVSCDLCPQRKVKAVMSCLQCLVSYCEEHIQPHYDVPMLKKHKLMEPTENLEDYVCRQHNEVMKMFCRTDQQCICYLCPVDHHKGHDTVTAAAERAEKDDELSATSLRVFKKFDQKIKDLEQLQQHVKNSSCSADAAVEQSDRSHKELLRLLDKRLNDVKQQIRSQQEAEELRVKELQDKMQQEIKELQRTLTELDSLSHTEDHMQFLQMFPSLSKVSDTPDSVHSSLTPPSFQDIIRAAVSKLRSALQETSLDPSAAVHKPKGNTPKTSVPRARAQGAAAPQQTSSAQKPKGNTPKTSVPPAGAQGAAAPQQTSAQKPKVKTVKISVPHARAQGAAAPQETPSEWPALLNQQTSASDSQQVQPVENLPLQPPEPLNIDLLNLEDLDLQDLQRYSCKLTFDPQSLNYKLALSNNDTVVKRLSYQQNYPPYPDRFHYVSQVVTKESLTGRCFWQVLVNYEDGFGVAVSYRSITRAGEFYESSFGMNNVSWLLEGYSHHFDYYHDSLNREIRFEGYESYPPPTKIGIFLDYDAGILAFYKVFEDDDSVVLLYTVRTTFTQPLVAGVVLEETNSTAQLL